MASNHFHINVQVLTRGKADNSVFRSAYIRRTEMTDERLGESRNFAAKEGLVHAEIALPEGAPAWVAALRQEHPDDTRFAEAIWNRVEASEERLVSSTEDVGRRLGRLAAALELPLQPHEPLDSLLHRVTPVLAAVTPDIGSDRLAQLCQLLGVDPSNHPAKDAARLGRSPRQLRIRLRQLEQRDVAQLARSVELAVPTELTREQQIALVRGYVHDELVARGMAADWVLHDDGGGNPHAHILVTSRPLTQDGFGPRKEPLRDADGDVARGKRGEIVYPKHDLWGSPELLDTWREQWAAHENRALEQAGVPYRVDHRSFQTRGLELEATEHLGKQAKGMDNQQAAQAAAGLPRKEVERARDYERKLSRIRTQILHSPEQLLLRVGKERSLFTRDDVLRELRRWVHDDVEYDRIMAVIDSSPKKLEFAPARLDAAGKIVSPARWTLVETLDNERKHFAGVHALHERSNVAVSARRVARVLQRFGYLAPEQRDAVLWVTAGRDLACVNGAAGAGKTSMLKAAVEIWRQEGYHVIGTTHMRRAAMVLEREAGIPSSTLHSLNNALDNAKAYDSTFAAFTAERADLQARSTRTDLTPEQRQAVRTSIHTLDFREATFRATHPRLDERTVVVLDEAGMVSMKDAAALVDRVAKAGAKIVMTGQVEQIKAIEAGAPFRGAMEIAGQATLQEVRRQTEQWQRDAVQAMSRGDMKEALAAFRDHGCLRWFATREEAKAAMAADQLAQHGPHNPRLQLAFTRHDVEDLNDQVRQARATRGELGQAFPFLTERGQDLDLSLRTREFAAGDEVVFLRNDSTTWRHQGVSVANGSTGTILEAQEGRVTVKLPDHPEPIVVDQARYGHIDHAYALSLMKSQGETQGAAALVITPHLTASEFYVGASRHRDRLTLYVGADDFRDEQALVRNLSRQRPKQNLRDFGEDALQLAERRGHSGPLSTLRDVEAKVQEKIEQLTWKIERHLERATWHLDRLAERVGAAWDRAVQRAQLLPPKDRSQPQPPRSDRDRS